MRLASIVLPAPGGHFQSALCRHLPAHVAEVNRVLAGLGEHLGRVHGNGLERFGRIDQVCRLRQGLNPKHADPFHHCGLAHIRFRHNHVLNAPLPCRQRRRKRAANGAHAAVERKLADEDVRIEQLAEKRSLTSEQAKRHR
jgi:S-adenosylmethionine:diacylglycerol 3-amino-3-carboxypropyl transferase